MFSFKLSLSRCKSNLLCNHCVTASEVYKHASEFKSVQDNFNFFRNMVSTSHIRISATPNNFVLTYMLMIRNMKNEIPLKINYTTTAAVDLLDKLSEADWASWVLGVNCSAFVSTRLVPRTHKLKPKLHRYVFL